MTFFPVTAAPAFAGQADRLLLDGGCLTALPPRRGDAVRQFARDTASGAIRYRAGSRNRTRDRRSLFKPWGGSA